MEISDRMTLDLLSHYAYVLHEDVTKLTDTEIDEARKFATEFTKNNYKYKEYTSDFNKFVDKQIYKAITEYDYEILEKEIFDEIKLCNDLVGINNWRHSIYSNYDYDNYLFIETKNNKSNTFKIRYNIKNKSIENCNIENSSDFNLMGTIHNDSYTLEEIDNIKI